ncbi:MAG: polysaccharide deacetylase family protein [Bacteroidetes bacterium]|nr:polysaccharide deacetylase family protein [Bacteroidota bacterium]
MPEITHRAKYIFNLMIVDLMGAELILTGSRDEYISFQGPRIEYAPEPSGNGIFIRSHGLLNEATVRPQSIVFSRYRDYPSFFQTADERSAFPFDLFAAAFYMVSRYEEYLPFKPDNFGRFMAVDSIATAGNFLHLPIVNLWTELLKDHIIRVYPGLIFREKKFRFVPTIDIDHAFAYRHRSFMRTLAGYGRSVAEKKWDKVRRRTRVLLGVEKDPYDTYGYIREIHDRHGLVPLWFILFANYGGNDNNVSPSHEKFRSLLRWLDKSKTMGIHPSLTSARHPRAFSSEIKGLTRVLRRDILISRQHFLKTRLPQTYRQLIDNGITDDYSMGYATAPGFRAGIADPFPFFDLSSNRDTPLMLHPVVLMDVTMRDYLNVSPDEAMAAGRSFFDAIKAVNGEFVTVWHNESFEEGEKWNGWRRVYEDLLEYSQHEG